jgi:hypothetical protein
MQKNTKQKNVTYKKIFKNYIWIHYVLKPLCIKYCIFWIKRKCSLDKLQEF